MLEKMPRVLGEALSGLKAGLDKTAYHATFADSPEGITLTSAAFVDGTAMPARFTADGDGLSPPLAWTGLPAGTAAVVLLVEDAGSPTPQPLVHLIAWMSGGASGDIAEGALPSPGREAAGNLGQNSFLKAEWLPPDPPTGHGAHTYLFQVYALARSPAFDGPPGRGALLAAMAGQVLAKGRLAGTYARP